MKPLTLFLLLGLLAATCVSLNAATATIDQRGDAYRLLVDGEPYEVKGAGGDASKALLVECGGNTIRTWGVGPGTKAALDEAHRRGLKVVVGIWLGHGRHGFDYNDPKQVRDQFDAARDAVQKFKDHPAVLMWSVGNEMEHGLEGAARAKMWKAVNDIGMMIKELDGNHPTMTVTAEIGGDNVETIRDRCPGIDVHGVNSYGGAPSLSKRYREGGGTKPYMITEFGPLGIWEIPKNEIGTYNEATSTDKAAMYTQVTQAIAADPKCLGSFAFAWGHKQEVTATWFGMLLPDDSRLAAVDVMTEFWTGQPPANRVPRIEAFELDALRVEPGATVKAGAELTDPEGDQLDLEWILVAEGKEFKSGGDAEEVPDSYPDAVVKAEKGYAVVRMPEEEGIYRVFLYVRDGHGGAATANLPVLVEAKSPRATTAPADGGAAAAAGETVLTIYGDEMDGTPYVPSGYMGEATAISMDERSGGNPQAGPTCIKVGYGKADGWGGVVWQNPPEDWGDQPGGHNLADAATLSFWARGADGGETVKFGFGLLGEDKKYPDSASGEIEVSLTPEWTRYTLDLAGKDMGTIKTGFYWVLAGQGKPVNFYLDDIRYEAAAPEDAAAAEEPAAPAEPAGEPE